MKPKPTFYEICIAESNALYPEFDAICLNCGHRIGAHGIKEFERCAKEYEEQTKLSDY